MTELGLLDVTERLESLLAQAKLQPLSSAALESLGRYFDLLRRWNTKMNLTAVRDAEQMLSRHFLESIACAQALPAGISTLLDFGSGAGFPGLPIAICRPEIAVTLAESQSKKSAFLREALRAAGVAGQVHGGRAETLPQRYACITLRAVDKMEGAVAAACGLLAENGSLVVLTTLSDRARIEAAADPAFGWSVLCELPGAEQRVALLGRR